MSRQMTKHELRMTKEWRSPKLEVQDRLRLVIWSFIIPSNFVLRISSFCSHLSNNVAAKLATFDFGRAFHQAREIVSDALARYCAFQTFQYKIRGFRPAHVTEHHLA